MPRAMDADSFRVTRMIGALTGLRLQQSGVAATALQGSRFGASWTQRGRAGSPDFVFFSQEKVARQMRVWLMRSVACNFFRAETLCLQRFFGQKLHATGFLDLACNFGRGKDSGWSNVVISDQSPAISKQET
jgi:hypothetical protein